MIGSLAKSNWRLCWSGRGQLREGRSVAAWRLNTRNWQCLDAAVCTRDLGSTWHGPTLWTKEAAQTVEVYFMDPDFLSPRHLTRSATWRYTAWRLNTRNWQCLDAAVCTRDLASTWHGPALWSKEAAQTVEIYFMDPDFLSPRQLTRSATWRYTELGIEGADCDAQVIDSRPSLVFISSLPAFFSQSPVSHENRKASRLRQQQVPCGCWYAIVGIGNVMTLKIAVLLASWHSVVWKRIDLQTNQLSPSSGYAVCLSV